MNKQQLKSRNWQYRVEGIVVRFDEDFPGVAESRGIWPFKRIVVGARFFHMHGSTQRAVLLHEAGHCKLFHMERRILALPALFLNPGFANDLCVRQELQADKFAADKGFGVELLALIRRMEGDHGRFYPSRERRIAQLEALTAPRSL